jgi:hypothetical protein
LGSALRTLLIVTDREVQLPLDGVTVPTRSRFGDRRIEEILLPEWDTAILTVGVAVVCFQLGG